MFHVRGKLVAQAPINTLGAMRKKTKGKCAVPRPLLPSTMARPPPGNIMLSKCHVSIPALTLLNKPIVGFGSLSSFRSLWSKLGMSLLSSIESITSWKRLKIVRLMRVPKHHSMEKSACGGNYENWGEEHHTRMRPSLRLRGIVPANGYFPWSQS